MITVALLGIVAAIALPSYNAYLQRSRVPAALDGLNSFYTRMEQRYQDTGNYANGANCGVAVPVVANFTVTCTLADGGQSFTANASGSGSMVGYAYRINQQGVRTTVAHPKGLPPGNCWSTKGVACDS
jgi:type IV pilus assembly protein PilE